MSETFEPGDRVTVAGRNPDVAPRGVVVLPDPERDRAIGIMTDVGCVVVIWSWPMPGGRGVSRETRTWESPHRLEKLP